MKTLITKTPVIFLAFILVVTASGAFPSAAMAATGPDLIIEEISLSPAEPSLGELIMITIAVKNQGETMASATMLTCYLDDTILDTESVAGLEPGIVSTVTFTWTATGGSHTIKATADVNDALMETNETNNTGTYALTTLAADLVIKTITWTPANPSRDDLLTINVVIENQGTCKSKYSTFDFLIDNGTRGIMEIASMEPGTSVTKTLTWITLSGEHTFTAIVDESNTTQESDETNNESTVIFSTMSPDLIVESIAWTPELPSKDDIVAFEVTVKNLGAGRADVSNLAYYIDDALIDTIQVPEVDAGKSREVTFTWKAIDNAHKVRAVIDYYRAINETNETNNEREVSLTTQPPDLVVTDISWLPMEIGAGDEVIFTVTLKNQGSGKAGTSQAAFTIDFRTISFIDFAPIPAGKEATATIHWIAEGGDHTIELSADYFTKIKESIETNNRLIANLTVALPDLMISSISFTPEKPAVDETVTITMTLTNQGEGDAPNFRIACLLDDSQIAVETMQSLAAGESADTTYQWKVKSGQHVFKALVDDINSVQETDEKNNSNAINIAPNLPDLIITNVSWSPADIIPGQEIIFSIDIENIGGIDAGFSRIVFYTDDTIAGYNDIDSIEAGAKITRTFTWSASEGQHIIGIAADSRGQVAEIDENNNTMTVNIPPPDLTVQAVTFTPADYLIGDTVTVTARIINQRGNKTPSSTATGYIDGFSIGTKEVPPLAAGEGYDFSFEWTAQADAVTFSIAADTGNRVMETDETNNEAQAVSSTTITDDPTIDLAVDNIGWQIDSHQDSSEVTFTMRLKNGGSSESGGFSLKYSFDNEPETFQEIASIPGGGTAELVFTAMFSTGDHRGAISLDINEAISETDESNNHYTFTFSTIAPDLVIRTITWGPVTANIGDNVTISVKVQNLGLTGTVNTSVTLTIDGIAAGSIDVPKIEAGSTVTLGFPWTAIEGEHTINVLADASQSIAESDETNNTRERTITFTKQEPPAKILPIINPAATADDSLLETWWWLLLVIGGVLALAIIYSTVRNMRKR